MEFTTDQVEEYMESYRSFAQAYASYQVAHEESKPFCGAEVVSRYYELMRAVPKKMVKRLYDDKDRSLLLEIIGSEEDLKLFFPSLEGGNFN